MNATNVARDPYELVGLGTSREVFVVYCDIRSGY